MKFRLGEVQEVQEVLELLKSTWVVVGMNQTLLHTLYMWTLFQQVGSRADGRR